MKKAYAFSALLLLIFITLKLSGVIAWSWWWVLSPVWVVAAIAALFTAFGLISMLVLFDHDSHREK